MTERWLPILGFDGYLISDKGNVKTLSRIRSDGRVFPEKLLSSCKNRTGYPYVTLYKDDKRHSKFLHRLVAEHFIRNPLCLPDVNHIDGQKNNPSWDNLEWTTQSDNDRHAYRIGLKKPTAGCFKKGNIPWNKRCYLKKHNLLTK